MTDAHAALAARAAAKLGLDPGEIVPLGGATSGTWGCGDLVIRLGRCDVLDQEAHAMAAAALAVRVPEVLDRVELGGTAAMTAAVLLTRLPGGPAAELTGVSAERARRRGEVCGALHAALATTTAPPELRVVGEDPSDGADSGALKALTVLHLDLHPFNVLMEEDVVSGVVDWANAAAGPADLDRARTWCILTQDPHARAMTRDPGWVAFVAGWSEAATFSSLSRSALLWAVQFMRTDLADRYPADELAHLDRLAVELESSRR